MDKDFKAQDLEAWKRLKELNDEERNKVLSAVQTALIHRIELSPKELEYFKEYTLGKLTVEQFKDIMQNLIAQFIKTNGQETSKRFLHEIVQDALISSHV